jgi:hypothetical protein
MDDVSRAVARYVSLKAQSGYCALDLALEGV